MLRRLSELPPATFLRAIPIAFVAILVIGIPSDLIENPIFGRPVEPKQIDYVILVITAALIGLVFAIRPEPVSGAALAPDEDSAPIWGGFLSFMAVGCPVCNQAVVALVGTSGALSWWAPVQPIVGLAAVGMLIWALKRRLDTYDLASCPIPQSDPPKDEPARSGS